MYLSVKILYKFANFLLLCFARDEGFFGFYKGLTPNLLRVVPACAITFVVYEHTSHYLLERRKAKEKTEANEKKDHSQVPSTKT